MINLQRPWLWVLERDVLGRHLCLSGFRFSNPMQMTDALVSYGPMAHIHATTDAEYEHFMANARAGSITFKKMVLLVTSISGGTGQVRVMLSVPEAYQKAVRGR